MANVNQPCDSNNETNTNSTSTKSTNTNSNNKNTNATDDGLLLGWKHHHHVDLSYNSAKEINKEQSQSLLLSTEPRFQVNNHNNKKKKESNSNNNSNSSKTRTRRWGVGRIDKQSSSVSSLEQVKEHQRLTSTRSRSRSTRTGTGRIDQEDCQYSESDSDSYSSDDIDSDDSDSDIDSDDEISYDKKGFDDVLARSRDEHEHEHEHENEQGEMQTLPIPLGQNPLPTKPRYFLNRFNNNKKGENGLNASLLHNQNDRVQHHDGEDDDDDNSLIESESPAHGTIDHGANAMTMTNAMTNANFKNKLEGFGAEIPSANTNKTNNSQPKKNSLSGLVEAFQKRRLRAKGEFDAGGLTQQEIDLLKRDVEMDTHTSTGTGRASMRTMDMDMDITRDPLDVKGGKLQMRWKDRFLKTLVSAAFAPEEYLDQLVDPEEGNENLGFYLNVPMGESQSNGVDTDDDDDAANANANANDVVLHGGNRNMRKMKMEGEKNNFGDIVELLQHDQLFDQFSDEEPGGFYNGIANTSSDGGGGGGDNIHIDEKQSKFNHNHLSRLMDEHRSLLDKVVQLEIDLKQSNHETEVWRLRAGELQRQLDGAGITRSLADNLDIDSDSNSDSNRDEEDLIQVESGSGSELQSESEKCTGDDEEDLIIVQSESSSNVIVNPTTSIQVNSESESTTCRSNVEEDLIIMHGESGLNEMEKI